MSRQHRKVTADKIRRNVRLSLPITVSPELKMERFVDVLVAGGSVIAHRDTIATPEFGWWLGPVVEAIEKATGQGVKVFPNDFCDVGRVFAIPKPKPVEIATPVFMIPESPSFTGHYDFGLARGTSMGVLRGWTA